MIRRQFMQLVALTGVGALNPMETMAASGPRATLVLQVKGFTCITCAVGLDTLLGREKGIVSSRSTYPEGKVTVVFDPQVSSEEAVRKLIAEIGFTVVSSHKA
ncbi:MAG: heavy metal-associated domain-containing protein [Terracidiphilus sp.]